MLRPLSAFWRNHLLCHAVRSARKASSHQFACKYFLAAHFIIFQESSKRCPQCFDISGWLTFRASLHYVHAGVHEPGGRAATGEVAPSRFELRYHRELCSGKYTSFLPCIVANLDRTWVTWLTRLAVDIYAELVVH